VPKVLKVPGALKEVKVEKLVGKSAFSPLLRTSDFRLLTLVEAIIKVFINNKTDKHENIF